jgi:hypothetical protein
MTISNIPAAPPWHNVCHGLSAAATAHMQSADVHMTRRIADHLRKYGDLSNPTIIATLTNMEAWLQQQGE